MKAETPSTPIERNTLQYEERLVCFIDLLGFKSAIDESVSNARLLSALHEALSQLEGNRLVNSIHESVPVLNSAGEFTSAGEAGTTALVQTTWPIAVTQFSDSFVLSCPATNHGSCVMLLRAIDALQKFFFLQLGMLMRGGVSKGPLIHIQSGPLFGPAMNEAYELESKFAIYPRVLLTPDAAAHLHQMFGTEPPRFFETFDGHKALDLVSCLWQKHQHELQDLDKFSKHLQEVEKDIAKNSPASLPKVKYLQDRLQQQQLPVTR